MSYLAHRYAQALHEAGLPEETFDAGVRLVREHPPLADALLSPVIPIWEKEAVLAALAPFSEEPTLLRFFSLLLHSRRFALLPDIAEEYRYLKLEDGHITECLVRCVHIPDEKRQQQLKVRMKQMHHKEHLRLVFQLDPTLIGGYIVTLDGITYDQSIRGKLLGLSRYLEEVNAI